jgi:hypothetical protein
MVIQKADPGNIDIQKEITNAVVKKVADEATYTIKFRGRNTVTEISAKGAHELYAECVIRGLCPEIQLVNANDKVVGDQWIVDGSWRAMWGSTGETYTIDARGSEPYIGGASNDPGSIVNRKAFGKALRNAHLAVVPAVIRKVYLNRLQEVTGDDSIVDSAEYAPVQTPQPRQRQQAPHEIVYAHAKEKDLDPVADATKIYEALGEKTVPQFLESHTPDEANAKIDEFLENKND